MPGQIDARLAQLGITLPEPSVPAANYIPARLVGGLLFLSGQVPIEGGRIASVGTLGADLSVEQGAAAARLCGLMLIAQARRALDGDLDRVEAVVKLLGMVRSTPEFGDHPKVINGCSDLMVEVFGEKGRHARSAVGLAALPFGASVEIEAILAVR